MSRSALAPRTSCFLSHPRSLLPLLEWAGEHAAGSQESLRPTQCHLSTWQGTTPRQRETKNCERNIFNAVTTHDAVRLCCQETWYLTISWCLVPCWRAKYLNVSEMCPALSPFPGQEMLPAASPYPLITSRWAPERTLLSHTKKRGKLSEIQTWSLSGCGPYPLLLYSHSFHPLQNLFSHVKTTPTPLPQVPRSLP